jgi:hypothetical protein
MILGINFGKYCQDFFIPRKFSSEVPCPDRVICVNGGEKKEAKKMAPLLLSSVKNQKYLKTQIQIKKKKVFLNFCNYCI